MKTTVRSISKKLLYFGNIIKKRISRKKIVTSDDKKLLEDFEQYKTSLSSYLRSIKILSNPNTPAVISVQFVSDIKKYYKAEIKFLNRIYNYSKKIDKY